jgi:membrane fusion protein (multidrug efflux system)
VKTISRYSPASDLPRPLALFLAAVLYAGPALAQEQPVSCLILPDDTIELAAPISGVVAEVLVERGQSVKAGDLVVRLDDVTQAAYLETVKAKAQDDTQLRQAEVRLEIARASVDRNRPVFEKRLLRGDEWDQIIGTGRLAEIEADAARHALDQARLEVARAEAALAQTRVYAPVDAVVLDIAVSVGEAAGNSPLASLAVIDPLKVELFVGASSYADWTPGQTVSLHGSQSPEKQLQAVVKTVDPVADAGTGILRVQLELPNPEFAILAGQQCELDLQPPG